MQTVINTPEAWGERASAPTPWEAALYSERSQTQRYLAALRHLKLSPGQTLLDYGCGVGRFSEFLHGWLSYYGYDWAPEMLDRLEREHPNAKAVRDGLTRHDHITILGPFNLEHGWSLEMTIDTVGLLWSLARRSLVLSVYRGSAEGHLHYTGEWLAKLGRSLSPWWLVDGSYLANDLMLVMER